MDENFKFRATMKSDEELHEYVDNREKYLPESVESAVEELQNRGVVFSDEELKVIAEDMQARRELAGTPPTSPSLFAFSDINNQIDDPDAPEFYSKRAIYVFSILFSVLFGSIMLAINVAKTPKSSRAALVALFGLGYTALTIVIAELLNLPAGAGIVISILGGYILNAFFWNKFIGNDTLYRLKPIWVPLTIGLVIAGGLLFIIFKYGTK
ncbi:hypothetical protein KXD93_17585 [Mucilaginibacter sp. BJC16-A38]|uniref:hypothetical protein n=1 Tax=Mucilaginibacter phenanthrenivorans TaxID=1234842 RepID=UPI0021575DA0|nr:hypothetical protein [Mucilaginibacter phenanthrenivorans]MCR8559474.1 hypothetical protein [Mucilaginibacter phenanthrenivorans]